MRYRALLLVAAVAAGAAALAQEPTAAPPADGTAKALAQMAAFRMPPGMKAELFAAEPQLGNPVAFTIDEKGRIFVAEEYRLGRGAVENRGNPVFDFSFFLNDDLQVRTLDDRLAMYKKWAHKLPGGMDWFRQKSDQVRLLEDTTGTGRADKSTVFAAGFDQPLDGLAAGVLAHDGDIRGLNLAKAGRAGAWGRGLLPVLEPLRLDDRPPLLVRRRADGEHDRRAVDLPLAVAPPGGPDEEGADPLGLKFELDTTGARREFGEFPGVRAAQQPRQVGENGLDLGSLGSAPVERNHLVRFRVVAGDPKGLVAEGPDLRNDAHRDRLGQANGAPEKRFRGAERERDLAEEAGRLGGAAVVPRRGRPGRRGDRDQDQAQT